MAVGIGGNEGAAEIHVDQILDEGKPALLPIGIDGIDIGDVEADLTAPRRRGLVLDRVA
jgi:hypothetical protein